jgi:hypothetical protein
LDSPHVPFSRAMGVFEYLAEPDTYILRGSCRSWTRAVPLVQTVCHITLSFSPLLICFV